MCSKERDTRHLVRLIHQATIPLLTTTAADERHCVNSVSLSFSKEDLVQKK